MSRPATAFRNGMALLVLLGCAAEPDPVPVQQPPPPPLPAPTSPIEEFAVALWPGEGIPVFDAAGPELLLRDAPSVAAPVRDTLRPDAGERMRYDSTRNVTIAPATIAVLRADTIAGRDFGSISLLERDAYHAVVPEVRIGVTPGTTLHLLQHRAEGTCFVRLEGRVVEANPCPLFDVGAFRPSGEPVTAWWIFVAGGAHEGGWVQVADSTVALAGRQF